MKANMSAGDNKETGIDAARDWLIAGSLSPIVSTLLEKPWATEEWVRGAQTALLAALLLLVARVVRHHFASHRQRLGALFPFCNATQRGSSSLRRFSRVSWL